MSRHHIPSLLLSVLLLLVTTNPCKFCHPPNSRTHDLSVHIAADFSEDIEGMEHVWDEDFMGGDSLGCEGRVEVMYVERVEDVVGGAHYLVDRRVRVLACSEEMEWAC